VKYPHLLWALANWGPHYKFAQAIGKSEARLSRCLSGRTSFTSQERSEMARVLGFSEDWLFEEVEPLRQAIQSELAHA
jgi:hypothetical protein